MKNISWNRDEIVKILTNANSLHDVFCKWVEYSRQIDSNFSQANVAKQLGYTSAGALSDILSKRRVLTKSKIPKLAEYFNLDVYATEYLHLLSDLEREKSIEKSVEICKQLEKLKLILNSVFIEASERIKSNMLAFELLSSFSIFDNNPSFEDLVSFFGKPRILEIERAILLLMQEGYIVRENKKYKSINFNVIDDSVLPSGIDGIAETMIHTAHVLPKITQDQALIINQIIPCKKEVLLANIPRFRSALIKISIETSEKNHSMIAKFVAGCYPINLK